MLISLAFMLATLPQIAPAACATELEAARQAYGTYDVTGARRGFGRVADGPCSAGQRAEAATELARILWLVDANGEAAVLRLRAVPASSLEGCAAAALLGRVLIESGRPREVDGALSPAMPACRELNGSVALAVSGAKVAIAAMSRAAGRGAAIRSARSAWNRLTPLDRSTLAGSRQRLALGLIAGNVAEARAGWRGFFQMDGGVSPSIQPPGDVDALLHAGLSPQATDAARAALCDALVAAGFDVEARRLAGADLEGDDREWSSARAYFRMRDRLGALLSAHDRAVAASGTTDDAGLEGSILAILRDAVAEAGQPATDPWPALRRLWNLAGTTGRSNGVEGLHLGHVSIDAGLTVGQARRSGSVRFVALDNMIANGFSGWLGDGVTGPGGWAADGRIIQVRTRYVQTAFDRAAIASPGPARYAFLSRLAGLEAADAAGPPATSGRFLPSLSAHLQLAAVDALAAEVRLADADPVSCPARFARLWYERSFEGTILQHEGRHILDQADFTGTAALADAELEYRAKLSELRYGKSPRVALANIYGRLLGGTTGHGIANLRLVEALTAWLARHGAEVSGYDPSVQPLMQLWRIDDRQLRGFATLLDPAAATSAPSHVGTVTGG